MLLYLLITFAPYLFAVIFVLILKLTDKNKKHIQNDDDDIAVYAAAALSNNHNNNN